MTEFHYRIFAGAEVLPVYVLVYIENEQDISNFESAGNEGRYHLCLHNLLYFTSNRLLDLELLVGNYYCWGPSIMIFVEFNKNCLFTGLNLL